MILENIDIGIDIDKAILQNIDIDKISNRFKFGISNRAIASSTTACTLDVNRIISYCTVKGADDDISVYLCVSRGPFQ